MKIDTVGIYQVLLSYKANGFNEAMVKKQLGGNAYSAEEIEIGLSVFRSLPESKQQEETNVFGTEVISTEPMNRWEQFVYGNSEDVTTIWFSSVIIGFILLAVISNKR